MSSIGHATDMVSRLKQNRDQSQARRKEIATIREQYINFHNQRDPEIVDKVISKQELTEVKNQIRRTMRRQRHRSLMLTVIWFTIVVCIVVGVVVLIAK